MKGWSGTRATRLRRAMATRLPLPCVRCGLPVQPTDTWDLDHLTARSEGGALWSADNLGPSHASCNRSHGATLGNRQRGGASDRLRRWT